MGPFGLRDGVAGIRDRGPGIRSGDGVGENNERGPDRSPNPRSLRRWLVLRSVTRLSLMVVDRL